MCKDHNMLNIGVVVPQNILEIVELQSRIHIQWNWPNIVDDIRNYVQRLFIQINFNIFGYEVVNNLLELLQLLFETIGCDAAVKHFERLVNMLYNR